MTDIEIIGRMGEELGIAFGEDNLQYNAYKLNKEQKVSWLQLTRFGGEKIDRVIFYLRQLKQLEMLNLDVNRKDKVPADLTGLQELQQLRMDR